jgi:O-antigen ligase
LGLVALVAVLVYLAGRDGGVGMTSWHLGGVVALSLLPASRELGRLPAVAQGVVAAWAVTATAALAFAVDRSDFVDVTLVYALMPMMALTTIGLLRRPWGRLAVVGLLVLSFALYWHRSFMQWWGYTMGDLDTRWLPLSWHNQSATLMAAFGVFFFAVALTTRRVVAAGAGAIAAMGLAGAWLAGSRGALVAMALGLLVAVWLGGRWQGWRRAATIACAVLLATFAVVAGLLAMDDDTRRVTSEQSASSNLVARLYHMEAAGGMFLSRPLSGYGLGSYGTSARSHTDPQANLTISPHNELLEAFAEGGAPLGLAVLAGAVLAGWLSLRVIVRPAPQGARSDGPRAQLEAATTAAAAATVVVLLSHALVDFDWRYPVLAALLAIMTALAWEPSACHRAQRSGSRSARFRPHRWLAPTAVVALTALLAGGLAGAWTERATPAAGQELAADELAVAHPVWDAQDNARAAVALVRGGELQAAARTVERTRPWNPGWSELEWLATIIEVERGQREPQALLDVFPPYPTRLTLRNVAAELLLQRGELAVAESLLDESLRLHRQFQGWGVAQAVARTWELRIELAARSADCERAQQIAAIAGAEPILADDSNAPAHFRGYAENACSGGA